MKTKKINRANSLRKGNPYKLCRNNKPSLELKYTCILFMSMDIKQTEPHLVRTILFFFLVSVLEYLRKLEGHFLVMHTPFSVYKYVYIYPKIN